MTARGLHALRIGLVGPVPPPGGGMANQTRQLAELLSAAGAEVTQVPVNAPYRPRWIGQVAWLRALARLLPYLLALWRVAARVDLFHVMANSGWAWHLFAAPAIWVARWRGVPVVINYRGGEAAAFLRRSARLVRWTLGSGTTLVVPSGYLQAIFQRFGMSAQIVPNIIDLSRFSPRSMARAGAPQLLVARNLEALYDNETAIRALKVVRRYFPQATLTLCGSGPQEGALRRLAAAQGLAQAVRFAGRLEPDAMAALYRKADLVLNPSLADNMPNSVLEAWASGVPVVSTNVGGIPHLAQDGVTASLVPSSNPSAMAQACVALLSNQVLWQQRAQAGLQEAQRYTWARVQPVLAGAYGRAWP